MKNKYSWFSVIALLLCSGVSLVDRFIIVVPDWLAVSIAAISAIFSIIFIVLFVKNRNTDN